MTVLINNVTKYAPRTEFEKIKNSVLGKKYSVTLNFIGEKRATQLNNTYRNMSYTPNILSFPLTDNSGEIYICPRVAKKQASKYNHSLHEHIGFLFIHGLLHLKGYEHSDTMDTLETTLFQKHIRNNKP